MIRGETEKYNFGGTQHLTNHCKCSLASFYTQYAPIEQGGSGWSKYERSSTGCKKRANILIFRFLGGVSWYSGVQIHTKVGHTGGNGKDS